MWQTVTREQLYEEVWSVPIAQLCQYYGLSDNGLCKVCTRLNVPVPARGYWAKVEAGHKVRKTALPSGAEPSSTQIWRESKRDKTVADAVDVAWLKEREAQEGDAAHAIEVVARRKRWHAAIAPLHEFLEQEQREIEASRMAQERYDAWPEWHKQRESGPDRMAWLTNERDSCCRRPSAASRWRATTRMGGSCWWGTAANWNCACRRPRSKRPGR